MPVSRGLRTLAIDLRPLGTGNSQGTARGVPIRVEVASHDDPTCGRGAQTASDLAIRLQNNVSHRACHCPTKPAPSSLTNTSSPAILASISRQIKQNQNRRFRPFQQSGVPFLRQPSVPMISHFQSPHQGDKIAHQDGPAEWSTLG